MSNVTYNIKLQTKSNEEHILLLKTLLAHQKIWNHISKDTFKTKNIDKKIMYDRNYHKCRKLFPKAPAQLIIRAKDSVYAAYKSIKSNKKLDSLQNHCKQHNLSIRLDKRLYLFCENDTIQLSTVRKGKRIICSYNPYPKFSELFSQYSVCDPLIFYKENQFWLSVSFEIPEPTHIQNTCIGVDLGIRRFAVTSEGLSLTDKDFLRQKRILRYHKRMLQSKLKTTRSSSSKKRLKKLKHKEQHKNRNLCYHISNKILQTKSNTIVLEDLSSLKKKNLKKDNYKKSKSSKNCLSQVPFCLLKNILTYKALLLGKKVVTVNPAYTSQNDHRGLERGIRKGCRYYASDGVVFDADWNASINIARKFTLKQKINKINHPISFNSPLDGKLNFLGRVLSTTQSFFSFCESKPNCL